MNTPVRPSDVGTLFDATPDNPRAVIGGNRPPPFDPAPLAEKEAQVVSFLDAAGEWLDLGEIETDVQAGYLNDFISGARGLAKQIEDWRVKAKAPHAEAAKAVDDAARPHADKLKKALDKALDMMGKYSGKKKRAAEEAARIERERLRAEQDEAERLRQAAIARNDISGEVDAERRIQDAKADARAVDKSVEDAGRARSASGAGRTISMVKIRSGEITNIRMAFMWVQDDPRVVEAVQMAVNAKIRAAGFDGVLPSGVTLVEKEQAR
jgi:hypothetical protein